MFKGKCKRLSLKCTRGFLCVCAADLKILMLQGDDQVSPQAKLVRTNPLSRKLQTILNSTSSTTGFIDDRLTQEALASMLPAALESGKSGRNLLGLAETQRINAHTQFLQSMQPLSEHLDAVHAVVRAANAALEKMSADLALVQSATTKLTSRTLALKTDRYLLCLLLFRLAFKGTKLQSGKRSPRSFVKSLHFLRKKRQPCPLPRFPKSFSLH